MTTFQLENVTFVRCMSNTCIHGCVCVGGGAVCAGIGRRGGEGRCQWRVARVERKGEAGGGGGVVCRVILYTHLRYPSHSPLPFPLPSLPLWSFPSLPHSFLPPHSPATNPPLKPRDPRGFLLGLSGLPVPIIITLKGFSFMSQDQRRLSHPSKKKKKIDQMKNDTKSTYNQSEVLSRLFICLFILFYLFLILVFCIFICKIRDRN